MNDKIKLKDACKILNGFAFKSGKYVDSGIRIIRIANVQKGYVEDERPAFYPNSEESSIRDYMLEEDDLLLSLTGNVGRVALLDKRWLPAALNQRVACLRIKDDRIIKDYLYFALLSDKFENDCTESSKGIAQKNMSTEWLKDYEIPLPSRQKQREIISSLKQLSMIIKNKTEQIQQLDDLIKARFVEMFGNNKYETRIIKDVLCESFWLMPATPKYIDEGIPYITSKNIKNRILNLDDTKFISENDYVKISKNRLIKPGDILVSMIGTLGQTAVVSKDKRFYGQNIYLLRLNNSIINTSFFCEFFNSDDIQNKLTGKSNQSTQAYLKANHIEELLIPIPPIAVQNDFAVFVAQVDKSKFAVQKSLEKTQLLFDSLMQEYFG